MLELVGAFHMAISQHRLCLFTITNLKSASQNRKYLYLQLWRGFDGELCVLYLNVDIDEQNFCHFMKLCLKILKFER